VSRILVLVLALGILACAGCAPHHSEFERLNAAVVTDKAKDFNENGAVAGSPATIQHLKNAQSNEHAVGPPEGERIATGSLVVQESNRKEADKRVESRMGWVGWVITAAVGTEVVLDIFGLGAIALLIRKRRKAAEEWAANRKGPDSTA